MNAVKRYGAYLPHDAPIEAVANVCERPDGEFVAHLDYVRLEARLAESERDIDQLVGERDHVETMADKLADAIATLLGVEIGEHSSGNCPWQNALDAFEDESLSAGRGNAAGGESRPCAPGPARGLRAQAATAEVVDSAERRSPAGQDSAPAPDESNRHSTASSARCAAPTHVPPHSDAALGSGPAQSDGGGAECRTAQVRGPR